MFLIVNNFNNILADFKSTKIQIKFDIAKIFYDCLYFSIGTIKGCITCYYGIKIKTYTMKKLYLILMLMLAGFAAAAQNEATSPAQKGDDVYIVVKHNPKFRGGMDKLYQYLTTNIKYPEEAKAEGIEGKVFVSFVVEKDGTVSNVKSVGNPNPILAAEAERVVKAMPKWKPGKTRRCKKVRVQYTLPINFQL